MSTKTLLKDTLGEFLFNQIKNNPNYQAWSDDFEMPRYISDNLSRTLRDYQIEAVKHFIYLFENGQMDKAKHALFNMATGTGKTLTMAAIVLYLYEWGYRNFIFLVHQVQIKDQAVKNFTEPSFEKYLFKKQVKFDGKTIPIKAVQRFNDCKKDGINFMFFSTGLLYTRLTTNKENTISKDDFSQNLTVIIADEAHRLNVDTKKKKDQEEENNWERAVQSVLHANPKNMLLEFTATVDLKNDKIHKKYQDKLVYKYDFLQFNKDGYSKQVEFLYNEETQIADQKRLLIVNAVALSEYRRIYAERVMGITINPIVLVKSTKIAQSKDDREFFHKVISTLRAEDFIHLKHIGDNKEELFDNRSILAQQIKSMFAWINDPTLQIGIEGLITAIKERFGEDNTMIYNSQNKERAELLPLLDNPRNTIRAIFSVNALNEGWDVLSLYDIIHFDISETKKVSLQDIQLIGRGARLFPYQLPKAYHQGNEFFGQSARYHFDPYKRKFDNAPDDKGRVLESFVYHFVKTGIFLENLQKDLLGEGIISEGVEKKTIRLKNTFMQSQTYQKGFVLINRQEYRSKNKDDEIDKTFKRQIIAKTYGLHTSTLSDKEQNKHLSALKHKTIKITPEYFSEHIVRKALICAENNFFRLNRLKNHIIGIKSMDEMIEKYLPMYDIKYSYTHGKEIENLSADEKLQLLISSILPEVRKSIDKHMPIVTGSHIFRPKPLSSIFQKEKNIYLVAYPAIDETGEKTYIATDERAKAQSTHDNNELKYDIQKADWYAYSENYGTSEEKRFVKYIASHIDELKQKYQGAEIYLIRNELDYYLFNIEDGRRFSPDYMMIINDIKNQQMYYQCLFEPKGSHLLQKDDWKEQALIALNGDSEICFDDTMGDDDYRQYLTDMAQYGYQEVKCLGFKFYNHDERGEGDFEADFWGKL